MSQEAVGLVTLLSELESTPGLELELEAPLARLTSLRVGGAAEVLATVSTEDALRLILERIATRGAAHTLLGMGSNVLVPEGGLRGVTLRLDGEFRRTRTFGEQVEAGCAVSLALLARSTARMGLAGLEAFSGFPSTVGGAVVMNAGCYGEEIADVLVETRTVDASGERHRLGVDDLSAAYRSTALQGTGSVVTGATFQLRRGDPAALTDRILELNRRRWSSLPSGLPNAGSIFRNPESDHAGRLIEAVGLKGRTLGGAQISPKHANVIVNRGGARSRDVFDLMLLAYRRVKEESTVALEPELVLLGDYREEWDRLTV